MWTKKRALISLLLQTVGIFRVAGSSRKKMEIYASLRDPDVDINYFTSHNLANALKYYCRETPDLIVPLDLLDHFVKTYQEDGSVDLEELRQRIVALPPLNRDVLSWVSSYLRIVARTSDKNRMTPDNIGIVFGPTLFRGGDMESEFSNSSKYPVLVKEMIINYESVFPKESHVDIFALDKELDQLKEKVAKFHADQEISRNRLLPPSINIHTPIAETVCGSSEEIQIGFTYTGDVSKVCSRLLAIVPNYRIEVLHAG